MQNTTRHRSAARSNEGPWFVVRVPFDFTSRVTHRGTTRTSVYLSGTYPMRPATDLAGHDLAVTELDVIITSRTAAAYWTRLFGGRTTHPGIPTIVTAAWPVAEVCDGATAVLEDDAHTVAGTFLRVA